MEFLKSFHHSANRTTNFIYGNYNWSEILPVINKLDGDEIRDDNLELYYNYIDTLDLVPVLGLVTGTGQIVYWMVKKEKPNSMGSKIMRKTIRNLHSNVLPGVSTVGMAYTDGRAIYRRKKMESKFN